MDTANMNEVAEYCSDKFTGNVMTPLETSIKIMFDDGLVYWERIASIMELTSFIIIRQPQHINLADVLTWYFEHTAVNRNGETINKKIGASGGWAYLLTEHDVLTTNYASNLVQNPSSFPTSVTERKSENDVDSSQSLTRTACACGEPITKKFVKVVQCKKCKMYLCFFPGCDYTARSYTGVNSHAKDKHPSQGSKAMNKETHCLCGEPKNRECGQSSVKCPNPDCPYIWCLIEQCGSNLTSMRSLIAHTYKTHKKSSLSQKNNLSPPNTATGRVNQITSCPCGEKIPYNVTKVFMCRKCRKQYICTYQGCSFTSSTSGKVQYHQRTQHAGQSWIARNRYTHCVCGELKNREIGLTYMKCTNQKCHYFWCLLDDCGFEMSHKYMLSAHVKTSHNNSRTMCVNCKLGTKTRDGQSARGVCENCNWRWCLVSGCNSEFDSERSLMNHQTHYHKISRRGQS